MTGSLKPLGPKGSRGFESLLLRHSLKSGVAPLRGCGRRLFIFRPSQSDCPHASLPCAPTLEILKAMSSSRRIAWMIGTWLFILVIYLAVSLSLKRGSEPLTTFGNLVQCILPLLANAGLLLNAGTPKWRQNLFWMLLAVSFTLLISGQLHWTYYEVYLHKSVPELNGADILFF